MNDYTKEWILEQHPFIKILLFFEKEITVKKQWSVLK